MSREQGRGLLEAMRLMLLIYCIYKQPILRLQSPCYMLRLSEDVDVILR